MRCPTKSRRMSIPLAAIAGLLTMCCGCGWHRAYCTNGGCGPCGDEYAVDAGGCESGACGGCDACGGDVYPGSCGTRVSGPCGGLSGLCLPLMCTRLACGSGCGGIYWNEWVSDPPDCCDPCSDGGCWVGPQTCPQPCLYPGGLLLGTYRHIRGIAAGVIHLGLYGYRPGCDAVGATGCPSCGFEDCTGCESCSDCGVAGCAGDCARADAASPTLAARGPRNPPRAAARPQPRIVQRMPQQPSNHGVRTVRR